MTDDITYIIEHAIPDARVLVMDPNQDGEHFEAIVISDSFEGMPLVRQHQAVMRPLTNAFKSQVHALALRTFTPAKWDAAKSQFNPDLIKSLETKPD